MIAVALLILLIAEAAGLGRWFLTARCCSRSTQLEAWLFSIAIGLGVLGYLVWILGLLGHLNRGAIGLSLIVLLPVAAPGLVRLWKSNGTETTRPDRRSTMILAGLALALLPPLLLECFTPPGGREWDSLSYHLAAPQAFIDAGRIIELPTDHHSYFPFLSQMLFTIGLLYSGFAGAKLLHLAAGIITAFGCYAIGRAWGSPRVGLLTTVVFCLTPFVIWEAGIAYIELTQAMYVTLAFHALLRYRSSRQANDLIPFAILCGLALAVKTLSAIPVLAFLVILLVTRPSVRHLIAAIALIVVFGGPFYLRTALLTGNPVYPFAYSLFGGKNWDSKRAAIYAGEQVSYGMDGHYFSVGEDLKSARAARTTPSIADRVRNFLLMPFALVSLPRLYNNYTDPSPFACLGFLGVTMIPLTAFRTRIPWETGIALAVILFWLLIWAATMQYARYLIPMTPLIAFAGASSADDLIKARPWVQTALSIAIVLQGAVILSYTLPRALNLMPVVVSRRASEAYVRQQVNVYPSEEWLNAHARPDDRVVLFEETRGYYLRRRYLWGNEPHSAYIPYRRFADSRDMVHWFLQNRVRYAMVNLVYSPMAVKPDHAAELRTAIVEQTLPGLFLRWYLGDRSEETWRRWLAQAADSGHVRFIPEASRNGVLVLEFVESTQRINR